MQLRLLISRLASSATRSAAARGLAVVCGLGFLLTATVLAARGGLDRWFFWLLVWALFVYTPLRILLEAAGTLAPALRHRLAAEAERDGSRFSVAAGIELAVDRLLEHGLVMPRIATPVQRAKARDGALAVLLAARGGAGGLPSAVGTILGCLDRWVTEIGPWAEREAGQNIQARWREVRALAAMAGMTKVLVAADALAPGRVDPAHGFLDACLDYCDDLALEVDVPVWRGPDLDAPISGTRASALRDAWKHFVETGAPALEARKAFIALLLHPTETGSS